VSQSAFGSSTQERGCPPRAQLTFDFFSRRFRNTGSRQSLQRRHNADCVGINPDIGHPAPRQPDNVDPGRKGADRSLRAVRIAMQFVEMASRSRAPSATFI